MKKSFVAVAVLGAFASTAFAADVTLYGVIDEGLNYTHKDLDNGTSATDSFEMKSGNQAGSRFGLKGTEDLGSGYKVGFILESGFNADAGSMSVSGTIFNREASLSLYTPFGQLSAGKIGAITQGTSSWGKMGTLSAFGTSYGDFVAQAGQIASTTGVWDNMIAYQTPSFAGVKVYAQYSMGKTAAAKEAVGTTPATTAEVENESSTDRYYALGATYDNGPAHFLFAVDSTNYKTWYATQSKDVDDSLTVTLGGNWDFDVARVYFGGQYYDEVKASSVGVFKSFGATDAKVKGYGLNASVSAPVLGGTSYFGAGYVDASEADSETAEKDYTAWMVSAGYKYDLSKRTNVYGVVTYAKAKLEVGTTETKPSAAAVKIGLRHNF